MNVARKYGSGTLRSQLPTYVRAECHAKPAHYERSHTIRTMFYIIVLGLATYNIFVWSVTRDCFVSKLSYQDPFEQLFEICAGYSIALEHGGDFYVLVEGKKRRAEIAVEELSSYFPNLHPEIIYKEMLLQNDNSPRLEPLLPGIGEIPQQRSHVTQCIMLNNRYDYTPSLLGRKRKRLLRFLEFSEKMKELGERLIKRSKFKQSTLCIHVDSNIDPELPAHFMQGIEAAAQEISSVENLDNWLVFSDNALLSQEFVHSLPSKSKWKANAEAANFPRILDLYVASRICDAVLLTGYWSKHGWLIGLLARLQENVYYIQRGKRTDGLFLPSWIRYTP